MFKKKKKVVGLPIHVYMTNRTGVEVTSSRNIIRPQSTASPSTHSSSPFSLSFFGLCALQAIGLLRLIAGNFSCFVDFSFPLCLIRAGRKWVPVGHFAGGSVDRVHPSFCLLLLVARKSYPAVELQINRFGFFIFS